MGIKRKKQLLEEFANRKPEMGIISFRSAAAGETFFGISKDTRADHTEELEKLLIRCLESNSDAGRIWG